MQGRPLAFPDYGVGQCINCGFLTKRDSGNPPEPKYYEATGYDRAMGKFWKLQNAGDAMPWCFLRIARFFKEDIMEQAYPDREATKDIPTVDDLEKLTFTAITRPRGCPGFYAWQEGLTPREHYEEFRMQALEEWREDFEHRMEAERRDWERSVERDRRKFDIALAAVVAMLALAEVTATIIGVLTN